MIGVILASSMLLWTFGKSMEDEFDGANRKNLLHFIQEKHGMYTQTSQDTLEGVFPDHTVDQLDQLRGLTYVSRILEPTDDTDECAKEKLIEKRELIRISTCAIFHKYSRGPGVPHTFVGFIRQWPALPRVVIFLSVCVLPIARVPRPERYVVRKVRALGGIYGVTYYLGFCDEFDVDSESLADQICNAEFAADPNTSTTWLSDIKTLVSNATHIVPHYHVVSTPITGGFFAPVASFIRKTLIEDVYRTVASMFPETENWITAADEIIHVGITARI